MSRILDREFKYVPASKTDIRKTFRRIRAEQRSQAERDAAVKSEQAAKVADMKRRTA